ncbi:long-chain fatty acid transport protein 4 isoform X1 [Dermatophagoides farinae]|uniref:long-chain fatty acid transport protein 4 isoform X1 n=2 Tax=Dermatophagoides farinae TaxID=6954 RepID=UPI001F111F9C|nr:long-chain fatty acid transport protein 4-like isoform X1 [Dermatophagoides farinae]
MVLVYVTLFVAHIGEQVINFNLWTIASLLLASGLTFLAFFWDFVRRFYFTFFRDISAGYALVKSRYFMIKNRNSNVPKLFSLLAEKYPDKICFYYKDEQWTYDDIEKFSNKVGNYFASIGYKKNDEIALVMNSRPEFVGIWLGLAKQGIVTAFINTNQRMETLVHSITVVNCKAVIFDATLAKNIEEAIPLIETKRPGMMYYSYVGTDPPSVKASEQDSETIRKINAKCLDNCIENMIYTRPHAIDDQSMGDKLYYIFTSGTTGLPKAAVIRHHRYIWIGMILRNLFRISDNDILYLTLPLYHNNAGTIGTCQSIIFGTTIVLRDKFSASQFWDDCGRYNCTVAMYIGELCRYLLAQPKKETDTMHKVRLMFGNGLRQEIWRDFKNRFQIRQIGEVYGSTEGNANVANFDFTEGACGIIPCCVPFICRFVFPVTVIRVDPATGEHIRDRNGLCKLIKSGEIGEIVGMIREDPGQSYPGYVNNDATKKKIIRNVLHHGDSAFLSGDLVEMDFYGYLYFRDRTGDTFRWKGENVSTNEVEAVIQKVVKLSDCVVFGVSIRNCDGKAGMAVIADPNHTVDVENLYYQLEKRLPAYAVPLFIRIAPKIDLTASFKLSKFSLEKDGFNISHIHDPLYYLDRKSKQYIRMDQNVYDDIQNGRIFL